MIEGNTADYAGGLVGPEAAVLTGGHFLDGDVKRPGDLDPAQPFIGPATGIAAAIMLYPATYLVATERDFTGSFSLSVTWMQRHTGALLGTVGVILLIGLVLVCCNCGVSGGLTTRFGPMAPIYVMPLFTIVGELLSVVTLTFLGSGCIAELNHSLDTWLRDCFAARSPDKECAHGN